MPKRGPKPTTAKGKLFGSDVTFQVLAAASRRRGSFRTADLLDEVAASRKAVDLELAKLADLHVLQLQKDPASKRDRPYVRGQSDLAKQVLRLPRLINQELEGDKQP